MKLHSGRILLGFAVGYYLGAKAGRERYEQLHDALLKARRSGVVADALEKVGAAADLGALAARDRIEEALAYDEPQATPEP